MNYRTRRATASDAQAVHEIVTAIPWGNAATKSAEGLHNTGELCERGEIFVVADASSIVSMMILKKDALAASCGYNIWNIPLISTIEAERRKGHGRKLVRKAKQVASRAAICAHPENEES